MISIRRTYKNHSPKQLAKTNREFKAAIRGMSATEAWHYFDQNRQRYRYNTAETKRIFRKMNFRRCSFCTRVIGDFDKAMTVEHIETKHDHPQKIFQWKNLLCACHTCNTERSTTPCARNQYLDPTSIPDLERYFSFLPDGTIHPDSSLTSEERQKADYMIRLYRLDRKDLECERREFFKNLLESDSFSSFLEKQDLSSQNIIFLSVFTYYRRCRERYGQQGR